jgi:hypothetical protein
MKDRLSRVCQIDGLPGLKMNKAICRGPAGREDAGNLTGGQYLPIGHVESPAPINMWWSNIANKTPHNRSQAMKDR